GRNFNRTAQTYFEYERNSGTRRTVNGTAYSSTSRSFDRYVTGLAEGSYRYRACVDNGDVVCGSCQSFQLNRDTYEPPIVDNSRPIVVTLAPVQRGTSFVTFDAFFNMQSCNGSTWFEYGTT